MNQLLVQGRVSDKSVFMLLSGRRFHVAILIYISKCLYFQTFFCLLSFWAVDYWLLRAL